MYFKISKWFDKKKIILKIDCKAAKDILQKYVKNLVSKQIFTRWQALLSNFDFGNRIYQRRVEFPSWLPYSGVFAG